MASEFRWNTHSALTCHAWFTYQLCILYCYMWNISRNMGMFLFFIVSINSSMKIYVVWSSVNVIFHQYINKGRGISICITSPSPCDSCLQFILNMGYLEFDIAFSYCTKNISCWRGDVVSGVDWIVPLITIPFF